MRPPFATAEGLRSTLCRLHEAGPAAWRSDREAEQLMTYTISKYRPLAHAHRCEPEDSAVAAFEAMRTRAVRTAADPWAVVTRAVQVSLIAEERANGLLCSPARARRSWVNGHHEARRFSDTEANLLEFHPAFRVPAEEPWDATAQVRERGAGASPTGTAAGVCEEPTTAFGACEQAVGIFVALGWPSDTATAAVEYVAARLIESGSRTAAHAMLRRDHSARALFDLTRASWATLLRLLIGNPNPDEAYTSAGHGILLRLLIGHPVADLLADDDIVIDISRSAPKTTPSTTGTRARESAATRTMPDESDDSTSTAPGRAPGTQTGRWSHG
ncbi:serine/arginine repetitive matrix protein 2 [Nocardioides carbamazepini]|uniref:serine/arginine repetitive matrix protein 2 n=1 Tax=Nocardioides carbamazepini TaxID=2854259 RepID=UPI002149C31D|nr:serine/arginine repetitive matrix protein 2 [Nocardioides carbamazepini]MCR1785910.1 serine/arginine repetitive matrix protein 2 [Nocardioides carbamazepini]